MAKQYSPLAIKYRPKKFSEIVGHEIVVKVLSQAITNNRLGPAVMFYGTRGIGKTTFARILARSLMCENPTPDPCGVCEVCTQQDANIQLDLIEMDAASHTGVDDIREIIETCKYQPNIAKYKIFIIDEVHMLSKNAFNALLKTLEEPPSHVKFLMATTEIYRVPETVLSRCLRFDLKKIDTENIAQYLSTICNKEGIKYDIESIYAIAKFARGSMRDALSTLDKAINATSSGISTGGTVASGVENNADNPSNADLKYSDIAHLLGVVNEAELISFIDNVIKSNVQGALKNIKFLFENSQESGGLVINSLLDAIHYMTCLKLNANILININFSDDVAGKIKKITENTTVSNLTRMWQLIVNSSKELQYCEKADLILDMLAIKLCYGAHIPDLYDIINDSLQDEKSGGKNNIENEKKSEKNNSSNVTCDNSFGSDSKDFVNDSKGDGKNNLLDTLLKNLPNATVKE